MASWGRRMKSLLRCYVRWADPQARRLRALRRAILASCVLLMMPLVAGAAANEGSWTNLNPASSPPPRVGHAMAYDAESDRIVLFSGWDGPPLLFGPGDTWAYDFNTNTWTNMTIPSGPEARMLHALAYDVESDRIVLFGGDPVSGVLPSNDTWTYDFNTNTWANMTPPGSPSPRVSHAMAYDGLSDRILLFGGISDVSAYDNGTWSYSFNENTWLEIHPAPSPPARGDHAMAYDTKSSRIIMFGGVVGGGANPTETWAYHSQAPSSFVPLFLLPVILAATVGSALVVVLFWRRRAWRGNSRRRVRSGSHPLAGTLDKLGRRKA